MGLSFAAKTSEIIFVSTLSIIIGLQILMYLLCVFFSKNFITACLCDIFSLPSIFACFNEFMKTSFKSS